MTQPVGPKVAAPTCPNCGGPLQAVALDADTCPWLCVRCARGWWQAEIDAAAAFRPATRDFGSADAVVAKKVTAEHASARVRRTSARPDSLPLLTDRVVGDLASRPDLPANFVGQVKAEQARRRKGSA